MKFLIDFYEDNLNYELTNSEYRKIYRQVAGMREER
tara:strand:- start:35 stop:142 length:108 start_codon:yes stop_codon:yes gene_type:complete